MLTICSFLDSNNTDLIRWSDDGRSFIVLDEDEFARTLIPELFKHNNYASFVRQLNMYGFHKTVNITDGSLRQSEKARKGVKPPSMYSHPYFRKNRPDLLWLIQKPTNKSSAKRKREGSAKEIYDSDDERQYSPGPEGRPHEIGASGVGQDLATLPRNELSAVRTELQKLQQQQRFISKMITQLKEQNDQFYRQATAFQALHDRHENSINAILTFLATFYNRSLDGTGAANLVNMFNNHQQQAQHGSVVEEFNDAPNDGRAQLQRYVKKTPLLLGAPFSAAQSQSPLLQPPGSAITQPSSARQSTTPPGDTTHQEGRTMASNSRINVPSSASPVVKEESKTPQPQQIPESDQMMSLINSVNATNASTPNTAAPAFDFNSALDHYQNANGNAPLTPQQRDNVLALMANQHGSTGSNNALISPQPPVMPDLNQFRQTQQQLEMLTNMQRQQDDRVQELNRRLQPLSPTGSIPGLGQGVEENPFDFIGNPGDYDPNSFFDFGNSAPDNADIDFNFQPTTNADASGNDDVNNWDFGNNAGVDESNMFGEQFQDEGPASATENVNTDGDGGRVESLSSSATSPAGTVPDDPGTPRKRMKRS
nr:isoform beta of heat shock factor protein 2 [Quercus suber]